MPDSVLIPAPLSTTTPPSPTRSASTSRSVTGPSLPYLRVVTEPSYGPGMPNGVQLPEVDGQRSSSAFGRAVVADALRAADAAAAERVLATKDWRSGYLPHFRRLIEVGIASYDASVTSA